ncbi:MAG: hypothetical protein R6W82_05970 [bacterium]
MSSHGTARRPLTAAAGLLFAVSRSLIAAASLLFLVFSLTPSVLAQGTSQAPPVSEVTFADLELRTIGPANMSGRIVDLAVVESDTYTFYVASATGGLWKTTDNGITYEPVFEREGTHSIGDVAVYQADPRFVWVGTGERANRQSSSWGDGVYRSDDGGETWTHLGLEESHHIGRIVLHPSDPDIAWVAAMGHLWGPNPERGLYRTTDGGRTWQAVLQIDQDTGVVDVAIDPSDPDILYAAAYQRRRTPFGFHGGGPGSGLYKSTDGGDTWRELTNGLPEGDKGRIGISVYRSDPSIVYVCVEQGWRYNASTAYNERRAGIYRSEDRGESWTFMSDWNPRPMYASQILVDPNDDQRIYMVNSYSFSDDGGKTFTRPRQSLHGDDRIVWVDPGDSRHVLKGDDGGLGISWDRGLTWLYATNLPVSQYYRVSVDMRDPYWVYGGLQDNGSWMGPNATYRREGVLNEDWIRTGGGDGFVNLTDPRDDETLYTESQYLGLSRLDTRTRQRQSIRPGDPTGAIGARRNWEAWGPGLPEPELGNAMEPANWDGPFLLSPHDPSTIYAGTRRLWRSRDRGITWEDLGDLTTGVDRRELEIMGERATETTPSLDDGIPYFPTLTAIEESPLVEGVLYVGTDDGNLQVSRDGGASWTEVSGRLPGVPGPRWVGGIDASSHAAGRVYVALDGHSSDDYSNYLFRSDDYGQSWTDITGDLPDGRVIRTVKEDPRNPDLVWIGCELGFFFSLDGGANWTELKNNMPTLAINDFVIHPRDNDLVLGSHGRGIWILDAVQSIQELTPEVRARSVHLFTLSPAQQIEYTGEKAHQGDMFFQGENPPRGAIIDFWLREVPEAPPVLSFIDVQGDVVARMEVEEPVAGINREVWDLEYSRFYAGPGQEWAETPAPGGFFVMPGSYTVRLEADGTVSEQQLTVEPDPRLDLPAGVRTAWTETLVDIGDLYRRTNALHGAVGPEEEDHPELARKTGELRSRVSSLYREVTGWIGLPTEDQRKQRTYYGEMAKKLEAEAREAGLLGG